MDYSDYMKNMQTGYSNLYTNPAAPMQPPMQMMFDALSNIMGGAGTAGQTYHKHGRGCGCQDCDCGCTCCIRCADVVEYARCGEVRQIPITFDNDTRRERDVTLKLDDFALKAAETRLEPIAVPCQFKLPPCGEFTVLLTVHGSQRSARPRCNHERQPTLDSRKVAYATPSAEGCTIRPIVIAVASSSFELRRSSRRVRCGGCCTNQALTPGA
jgi:hypothetical protein